MAGEQKGKAYEAFTKAALERLKTKGQPNEHIFWDERPEGMSITPDLTIGTDKDHIHTLILITHSGSAGDSHKKFWRNLGELCEAKLEIAMVPDVYSLIFDPIVKEELKKAQAASFDGQLLVGDLAYGTKLQAWIDGNLARLPKDKHEKVTFLHDEAKTDKLLSSLLGSLQDDLKLLLAKKAPPELDQIWTMERKRPSGKAPRAKDTFVRRGLSKLMIFEDLDVAIRLFSGKRVGDHEVPAYAYELGLAGKAVGRATPADEEIANAIATIGEKEVRRILKKAPILKLSAWLTSLRNIQDLLVFGEYLVASFKKLSTKNGFLKAITTLHSSPSSLVTVKKLSGGVPESVWLFELVIEVIKQAEDESSGYGYAQLGRDVVSAGYGTVNDLSSANQFGGGFGLSAWLKRSPKSGFRSDLLAGCADVISKRLSNLGARSVQNLLDTIKTGFANNIIESKLCTYKGFEPLPELITSSIGKADKDAIRSCFGEKAELPGQATKTTILRKGKTLINWQSVSDAGRDHKKKELCGRSVALRYSWDSTTKKFIKRPGVEKLLLVVDGTWRREDLLALARAGWDEIFYPDEMDKLAKAIV